MPGEPNPRIEVVVIPAIQPVGWMRNRADTPGEPVRAGGIELAHEAVLRGEGALIRIAQADIGGERRGYLPVILYIKNVGGGGGEPAPQLAFRSGRGDINPKENS